MARSNSALQMLHTNGGSTKQSVEPPADRGRLLTAAQVAAELFNGTVSAAWVRRNVPHKVVLGHSTVRWYAADVQGWISTKRCSCERAEWATDC